MRLKCRKNKIEPFHFLRKECMGILLFFFLPQGGWVENNKSRSFTRPLRGCI